MVDVLITGAVGLATTIVSSWISWYLARRKYNAEVDSNEIDNIKKSLEFYEDIIRDNNKKLQFYIRVAEEDRREVYRLKGIVHRLLNNTCLDTQCVKRMFLTEQQIAEILGKVAHEEDEEKEEIKDEKFQ